MLLLVLAVAWRWWPLLHGHWRGDDAAILLHAVQARDMTAFWRPEVWQVLSTGNLTPWVTLSFQLDLALGGPVPAVFYGHQLVAAAALAVAGHGLARHWLPPAWAAGAVLLFLAGAPAATVIEDLMTRHYLEGLLLTLLALLAWLAALRQPASARWGWLGALAYAAACTAKEIYVPLPVLLLAWPGAGPLARRVRLLLPYAGVLALYGAWRLWMLGATVGGYSASGALLSAAGFGAYAAALARFPGFLFGAAAVPVAGVLAAAAALAWRRLAGPRLAFAGLLAALLLAPLFPLALSPGLNGPDRYLLGVWAGAVAGMVALLRAAALAARPAEQALAAASGAAGAAAAGQWRWPPLVAALALACGIVAARWHDARLEGPRRAVHAEFEAFSRFVLVHGAEVAYRPTEVLLRNFWSIDCLCQLKAREGGSCPVPLLLGWAVPAAPQRLFDYDPARRMLVENSAALPQALREATALDPQRPLTVDLTLRDGWAAWQLGPETRGRYFIVSPVLGRFELPPQGQLRTPHTGTAFTIVYESPEGWATASAPLHIRRGERVRWQRP